MIQKEPNRRDINLTGHWKTNFQYPFLGSHDLPEMMPEGGDLILTIKEMYQEEVTNSSNKTEWCNVAAFHEKKVNGFDVKPMIINKTNFSLLQKAFGSSSAQSFINKRVYIYVKNGVRSFQGIVSALRFRDFLPPEKKIDLKEKEIKLAAQYLKKHGNLNKYHEVRNINPAQEKQIQELAKTIK